MIRIRLAQVVAVAWGLLAIEAPAQEPARPGPVRFRVQAGRYDRQQTPIRFELPEDRFGPGDRKALDRGPIPFLVWDDAPEARKGEPGPTGPAGWTAQAERVGAGPRVQVTFILGESIPKGQEKSFRLQVDTYPKFGSESYLPWTFDQSIPGALVLKHHELKYPEGLVVVPRVREVFRYNATPVSSPNYGPIQHRDAYIHPAFTPAGALITGDFSPSHPHHRGFFLAYERTKAGPLTPDFWNIHVGTGKIHADGLDKPVAGPVTARFSARHRWEAKDKATGQGTVVLRERWDVEAYAIPGAPYWLFDLTSTQQAVDRPLEVLPYRYGGMAYRGPEPFVKGKLDVLTSEKLHRVDGDQKPARWVDLTGPVAEGSDQYGGAMIADHPANPTFPTVARIHPTTLPFFCFVPAYNRPLNLTDTPTVFRYRAMIHDGRPDFALDERVARDFAETPTVVVE